MADILLMNNIELETKALLQDTLDYYTLFGEEDRGIIGSELVDIYTVEAGRISLRITALMTWLNVHKCVARGEMPLAAAIAALRDQQLCMEYSPAINALPSYVGYLMQQSFELYARAQRLDTMIAERMQRRA